MSDVFLFLSAVTLYDSDIENIMVNSLWLTFNG
jgi:hypothetical protein